MGARARTTFTFKGGKFVGAARAGAARGVTLAAERLGGHSAERAPIDLGDLRNNRTVEPATEQQNNPTAILVFNEPYAALQHEDESLNHTPGANGEPAGEAKFVEKNVRDSARRQEYRDIIGAEVIRAYRRA